MRPGPGAAREEVERNQRERLFGATVAVTTTKGYAATTVADLVEVAGVSRATFYAYFVDKEECFLATLDEILAAATSVTTSRIRRDGSWEERAQRAVATSIELLVSQPAASRLCLVEAYAAGPAATRRVDAMVAGFQELMTHIYDLPGQEEMPAEMTRAMVGGLRKLIHTRLRRRTERELADLVPALVELGLAHRPPPRPLRSARPRRSGQAPAASERPEDPGERIVRATLATVAAKGYRETTIADIATAAAVSLRTFYEHFDGKEDAFEAALYSCRLRMLAAILPVYRRGRSWPEAIRATVQAALAFLESEPDFAQAITVDVYTASAAVLERRDQGLESMHRFIEDGFQHAPQVDPLPIAGEAISSVLYSMLCDRVQSHGPQDLRGMAPLATYMILAPFLGAGEACEVANGAAPAPAKELAEA